MHTAHPYNQANGQTEKYIMVQNVFAAWSAAQCAFFLSLHCNRLWPTERLHNTLPCKINTAVEADMSLKFLILDSGDVFLVFGRGSKNIAADWYCRQPASPACRAFCITHLHQGTRSALNSYFYLLCKSFSFNKTFKLVFRCTKKLNESGCEIVLHLSFRDQQYHFFLCLCCAFNLLMCDKFHNFLGISGGE